LQVAVLAAAVAHTPEAEEVLRGARTRLARKPGSCSRELLRNFPKGKARRNRSRRRRRSSGNGANRSGASAATNQKPPVDSPPTSEPGADSGSEAAA
jgi:hypothetical protein